MTDTMPRTQLTPGPQEPERRRGPWVALIAAAAVILVGAVFAVATLSNDDSAPAATTTTVLSSPLEVVEAGYDAYRAGEIDGFIALATNDAEPDEVFEYSQGSRLLKASAGRLDVKCEPIGEDQVRCFEEFWSGFGGDRPIQTATVLYVFENGLITEAVNEEYRFTNYYSSEAINISLYRQWLQASHPEDYPNLFELDVRILLDTPERMDLHTEYIAEYVASKG